MSYKIAYIDKMEVLYKDYFQIKTSFAVFSIWSVNILIPEIRTFLYLETLFLSQECLKLRRPTVLIYLWVILGLRNGDTRLVSGRNKREGRVEVYSRTVGRWGTVCDKQWTSAHTAVVCRHLGYSDQGGK